MNNVNIGKEFFNVYFVINEAFFVGQVTLIDIGILNVIVRTWNHHNFLVVNYPKHNHSEGAKKATYGFLRDNMIRQQNIIDYKPTKSFTSNQNKSMLRAIFLAV